MMDLLDKQLGRIFFGIAVFLTAAMVSMNLGGAIQFEGDAKKRSTKSIQVVLKTSDQATDTPEVFFPEQDPKSFRGSGRFPFIPPVKTFEFKPVDLAVPTTGLVAPPQVLPSPGPSLEGTASLPRWGKEFPPLEDSESE